MLPAPCAAVAFVCNSVQGEDIQSECQPHTFAHMAKTAAISVRVSDQVKAAVEKAAAEDSRPVASLVEKVLVEWLKAKRYLK